MRTFTDTERIDFLEKEAAEYQQYVDPKREVGWLVCSGDCISSSRDSTVYPHSTLRDAVDAAMFAAGLSDEEYLKIADGLEREPATLENTIGGMDPVSGVYVRADGTETADNILGSTGR